MPNVAASLANCGLRDPRQAADVRGGDVAPVAGEYFVAAVAVQHHGYVVCGHFGDLEAGDSTRVSEWLVVMPHHGLKPFHGVELQGQNVVLNAQSPGCLRSKV